MTGYRAGLDEKIYIFNALPLLRKVDICLLQQK
jgi:hypothetical protein